MATEQHLRVGVVGVHVLDDPGGGVDQRIGLGGRVVGRVDPAHAAVPTDVADVVDGEPQEREVAEVDVVRGGGVGLEVAVRATSRSSSPTGASRPSNVTRPLASGSAPSGTGSVTRRLARGSRSVFCVCSAIMLTKKSGSPLSASPKLTTEPYG